MDSACAVLPGLLFNNLAWFRITDGGLSELNSVGTLAG